MRQILAKLSSFWPFGKKKQAAQGRAFLTFQSTAEVIRAEQILKAAGYEVAVMGPPPWLQTGCDMVVVFDGISEPAIRELLKRQGLTPEQCYPLSEGMLTPVSLVSIKEYGDWFMVQAANMKITVAYATGLIVNVSGGGCPDVPYLAQLLTGQSIATGEEPRVQGKTLCSYALQKAFEEARSFWLSKHHGS